VKPGDGDLSTSVGYQAFVKAVREGKIEAIVES